MRISRARVALAREKQIEHGPYYLAKVSKPGQKKRVNTGFQASQRMSEAERKREHAPYWLYSYGEEERLLAGSLPA